MVTTLSENVQMTHPIPLNQLIRHWGTRKTWLEFSYPTFSYPIHKINFFRNCYILSCFFDNFYLKKVKGWKHRKWTGFLIFVKRSFDTILTIVKNFSAISLRNSEIENCQQFSNLNLPVNCVPPCTSTVPVQGVQAKCSGDFFND